MTPSPTGEIIHYRRSVKDYKKMLRLHNENKLSGREIAATSGCSKISVNEFLKRFRECPELNYPLPD